MSQAVLKLSRIEMAEPIVEEGLRIDDCTLKSELRARALEAFSLRQTRAAQLTTLSIGELKSFIVSTGGDWGGCLEKRELSARAQELAHGISSKDLARWGTLSPHNHTNIRQSLSGSSFSPTSPPPSYPPLTSLCPCY